MNTKNEKIMNLYFYLSIESFVQGCKLSDISGTFILRIPNLMYSVPEGQYRYGLSLLRKAIGNYEEQKGIPREASKQGIPFFREDRRILIGPEMEMYTASFYESTDMPSGLQVTENHLLRLTVDYESLAKYCLFENLFLLRCKYDEEQTIQTFVRQMDCEYNKFFFDDENSGFTADSHFFSLLCNACMEVKKPHLATEREWRMASFREPADVEYHFVDGQLTPLVSVSLPFSCLRQIMLQSGDKNDLTYSALLGFMRQCGVDESIIG